MSSDAHRRAWWGTGRNARALLIPLLLSACSSPSEPVDDSLPSNASAYQYLGHAGNRYFQRVPVPDTCGGCADTLIDSVWRVYVEDGVTWAQSYRAVRHWVFDTASSQWIHLGDEGPINRREGLLSDSLMLDPSLRYKLLVAPVVLGRQWNVDDSGTITAQIVAEETLTLGAGAFRTWHVMRGAMGDEWWAPGLGRIQYEELVAGGGRRKGSLIGTGDFP